MDSTGLSILLQELQADCTVAGDAGRKATLRLSEDSPGRLEACAYELARCYNVLEKMLERVCFLNALALPIRRTGVSPFN